MTLIINGVRFDDVIRYKILPHSVSTELHIEIHKGAGTESWWLDDRRGLLSPINWAVYSKDNVVIVAIDIKRIDRIICGSNILECTKDW